MAGENRPCEEIELDLMSTGKKSSLAKTAGMETTSRAPAQQRLSPIPELDRWERETDASSPGFGSSWALDNYSTSSTSSLSESQERGEDCAELLLNCLFCRFYDLFLMLPETCERAANRICPAYMYFSTTAEGARSSDCKCNCNFDCGLMDACHDTGECIELAMEISEVCYR
ncbi:myoD family inhibitor domain-containing protein 2 [Triplophysa dalaica]|uniref:myoD family inhibitor domain-containing protein 2 n=1 Tax=Triplophysa dalaica TaxID=1582913 RepID=UPI0024DFE69D|nr:myoD family inhibitor domain-containing protein 2 [Triplophysa dalaica]